MNTGFARITGTVRDPWVELNFSPRLSHPSEPGMTMLEWVKKLGGARWDPAATVWRTPALGPAPSVELARAGIMLEWDDRPAEFADVPSIDHLAAPVAKLSQNRRTVLIRHRLAGYEHARELIGQGAVWDGDRRLFRTDVADALVRRDGMLYARDGVIWPDDVIAEAVTRHQYQPVPAHHTDLARDLAKSLGTDAFAAEQLAGIGTLPTDGRVPFPYQVSGAYAAAAGRTCLFDEPGVGKTATSLYAARILGSKRTLVVVPPLLTSNWKREIGYANLCAPENVAMFRPGRKEPELPDEGAVIIADSLLASRPATAARIADWGADVMIVDEAHRLKTIGSARGDAVLDVAVSVKHAPIVLTGTPIFQSPHEMITLLELSRMMAPIFGGRSQFLEDFCLQTPFGKWEARKLAMPRLLAILTEQVMIRRKKKDVLPQLPPKVRERVVLDAPLKLYREAHKDVVTKVKAWLTWFEEQNGREPQTEEVTNWIRYSSFTLISQLRQAAGLIKVDQAAELIRTHINETGVSVDEAGSRTFNRPLIVWVHHRSVGQAMFEALPEEIGLSAMISGETSDDERDRIAEMFQAGRIAVLVASIMKAGVGLTLTRGSDSLFVELDWTPANMIQAEDRQHRHGATAESIYIRQLVAANTLDEIIQNVLARKFEILEKAIGDDAAAPLDDDTQTMTEVVTSIMQVARKEWLKERKAVLTRA